MASKRGDSVLRVRLTGDSGDFAKAMKQAADHLARTDARFKDDANSMSQALGKVGTQAKKTEADVAQASKGIGESFRGLSLGKLDDIVGASPLGGLVGNLGGVGKALGGVGTAGVAAATGVGLVVAGAAKLGQVGVANATAFASEVRNLGGVMGLSSEEAQKLWQALASTGVDPRESLDLLSEFTNNLAQNGEEWEKLGVTIDQGPQEALFSFLDVLKSTTDPIERARLAADAFGEEWRNSTQLILGGGQALREAAAAAEVPFSKEDLSKIAEYQKSWNELGAALKVATAEFGVELIPALTDVATTLKDTLGPAADFLGWLNDVEAKAKDARSWFDDTPLGLSGKELAGKDWDAPVIGVSAIEAVKGLLGVREELTDAERNYQANARSTLHHHAENAEAAKKEAKELEELAAERRLAAVEDTVAVSAASVARVTPAVEGLTTAREALAQASQTLADAQSSGDRAVAAAEASAAKSTASAEQAVADAYTSAAKSIASAQEQVQDAVEDRAEAMQELAEAEVEAQELMAEAAEDANRRIADAEQSLVDAREQARRSRRDDARKLEDAEQALADALNQALAEDDTVAAQRIREEAIQKYNRTKEDLAESEQDIIRDLSDAETDLKDTHVEAAERRAEAEERAGDMIRSAKERVADANKRVADSERNVATVTNEANAFIWQSEQNLRQATIEANAARAAAAQNASAAIAKARMAEITAINQVIRAEQLLREAMEQTRLARLSLAFQDPGSRAMVASGISEFAGHAGPSRAGGGRVQEGQPYLIGGSHGLEAFVPDGPGTVVPQRDLLARGGDTFIVNGSIISERELVEIIERAKRKGRG